MIREELPTVAGSTEFVLVTPQGDVPVRVCWNRRRRTRVGMLFDPAGTLHLDAPGDVTLREVESIAAEHRGWIGHRSRQLREANGWRPAVNHADGVMYLGRPLAVVEAGCEPGPEPRLRGGRLMVAGANAPDCAERVAAWVEREADRVLGRTIESAVERLGWLHVCPPWRHRYMRSQWGSCTASGRISLNTHLVKIAPPLIEYVVVHELCHLRVMNHGPRFYALLGSHLPDWKHRRRELDKHVCLLLTHD